MLVAVARKLDAFIVAQSKEAEEEGSPQPQPCKIQLLGQMALFEADLGLDLVATEDVDVKANYSHEVQKEFERLLQMKRLKLDPVGHEAWMPKETKYEAVFKGRFVSLLIAEPEAVLISKALKAPEKNKNLIRAFIACGASDRFFELAETYRVDLEQFQ